MAPLARVRGRRGGVGAFVAGVVVGSGAVVAVAVAVATALVAWLARAAHRHGGRRQRAPPAQALALPFVVALDRALRALRQAGCGRNGRDDPYDFVGGAEPSGGTLPLEVKQLLAKKFANARGAAVSSLGSILSIIFLALFDLI